MPKLKVLFLCTGNSCRSQMAEGWARQLRGNIIEPFSAGIEKHGMNPHALKVMGEAGVDISSQPDSALVCSADGHLKAQHPFRPNANPPKLAQRLLQSSRVVMTKLVRQVGLPSYRPVD